jgi:hypothetical protein
MAVYAVYICDGFIFYMNYPSTAISILVVDCNPAVVTQSVPTAMPLFAHVPKVQFIFGVPASHQSKLVPCAAAYY